MDDCMTALCIMSDSLAYHVCQPGEWIRHAPHKPAASVGQTRAENLKDQLTQQEAEEAEDRLYSEDRLY